MILNFPKKLKPSVAEVFTPHAKGLQFFLPLYASPVSAGFPSLAEDYIEGRLDLNEHLIQNPQKTFIVKVSGDSMIDAGIHPEDLLIVDQTLDPQDGNIVIAALDGDLTVKRLCKQEGQVFLMPENPGYPGIEVHADMSLVIWGVVTNVIHKF